MCRNCSEAGGNVLIFNAAHFKESLFFTLSYFHSPETIPRRESLPIISSSYDCVSLSVHSLSNASGFFRWDWRLTHSLYAWVKTRTEQYRKVMGKEEKAQSSLGWGRWRPILVLMGNGEGWVISSCRFACNPASVCLCRTWKKLYRFSRDWSGE